MITKNTNLIYLTLITLTTFTQSLKQGERCLLQALNPSDHELKYLSDYSNLTNSVLDYPLLPEDLQRKYINCKVNIELKEKCDAHFYPDQCEECGMIYVKKCPKDYIRLDCGLCASRCPEGTIPDAAGALCKKPEMIKKGIFKFMIDCTKEYQSEGCTEHEGFSTSNCPTGFDNVGNFLCSYKCPLNFTDKEIYCVPDIIENSQYFMSNFSKSDKTESVNEY